MPVSLNDLEDGAAALRSGGRAAGAVREGITDSLACDAGRGLLVSEVQSVTESEDDAHDHCGDGGDH
jgi:hypothetical protein